MKLKFQYCGLQPETVLRGEWAELHQILEVRRTIIATHKVQNGEDILLGLQITAAQTRALLSIRPNFALFDPPPVKIRGAMGEMSE